MKKSLLLFCVSFSFLLTLGLISEVKAATLTWTGAVSGSWNNSSNWSPAQIPVNADSLIFPAGPTNTTVSNDVGGVLLDTVQITGTGYIINGPEDLGLTGDLTAGAATYTEFNLGVFLNNANDVIVNTNANIHFNDTLGVNFGPITFGGAPAASISINDQMIGTFSALNITDGVYVSFTNGTANSSTYTAAVNIVDGLWTCRVADCFGDPVNVVDVAQDTGAIVFYDADMTIANSFTFNGTTSANLVVADDSLTLTGAITFENFNNISLQGSDFLTLTGSILGAGDMRFSDGTVNIDCGSVNTGSLDIRDAILSIDNASALGAGSFTTIESGSSLVFSTSIGTLTENIQLAGSGKGNTATLTTFGIGDIDGTVNIAGNVIINTIDPNETIQLDGEINGNGNLTKNGPGTIRMSGSTANSYVGSLRINSGEIIIDKDPGVEAITGDIIIGDNAGEDSLWSFNANQIADNANILIKSSGRLRLDENETLGSISGAGLLIVDSAMTLTLTGDTDQIFSGIISGGPTFIKNGDATWSISDDVQDATFQLNAGTLKASGNLFDTDIQLNGGNIFANGFIGSITAQAGGGKVNPGQSPGSIQVSGPVTFNSAVTFVQEIAGNQGYQYDQFIGEDTIDLNNAELEVILTARPQFGYEFTIISAVGGLTGTFDGLPDGATISANGNQFRINYTANDVTLTAITSLALTGIDFPVIPAAMMLISLAGITMLKFKVYPNFDL